jgi:hypothetical protein
VTVRDNLGDVIADGRSLKRILEEYSPIHPIICHEGYKKEV